MEVKILSYTKDPLMTIAQAASICYRSQPSMKIVNHCIDSGHCSVLEHASFTFLISGVDRNLTHQLVRHRIASYSQESQRYVDMSNNKFIIPTTASDEEKDIYNEAYALSSAYYSQLIENGAEKEDARNVLPGACETTIVMTMNLRTLTNFMNERLCTRAQLPIRTLAIKIKNAVLNLFTTEAEKEIIKKLFVPKCEKGALHFCPEAKSCDRHKTAKEIIEENNAQWIFDGDSYHCSKCSASYSIPFVGTNYCPNCGANMKQIKSE